MSRVTLCTVPGCGQVAHARGLCNTHYLHAQAGRTPTLTRRKRMLFSDTALCATLLPGQPGRPRRNRLATCPQEAQLQNGQPVAPKTALADLPDPRAVLTNRQLLIFAFTAAGFSAEEIAQKLCCSRRTVETHRDHIGKRLQIHSKLDLWRLALRHQLVTLDVPLVSENPR